MNGINIKFEVNLQSQLQLILEISVDSPFVLDPDFGPDCMDFAVLGAGGRAGGGPVQSKKDMFTIHYLLFTIHYSRTIEEESCLFFLLCCMSPECHRNHGPSPSPSASPPQTRSRARSPRYRNDHLQSPRVPLDLHTCTTHSML